MKAMLLAAGFGTRMRPLTLDCPKPLLKAAGKPLIVYHIERLAAAGISELVINSGWLGEQLEAALGDGSQWGVHIAYSREPEPLETAGGLRQAASLLGEAPFLVINADIWCDVDFTRLAGYALAADRLAHLVLVPNPPHHPQGDFALSTGGRVSVDGTPKLTFAGIGLYRPALLSLDNNEAKLAPLLRLAMARQAVSGETHQGHWWDIGTPERLDQLDHFLQQQETTT